jgi:tRNA pseudouridine55 synthase
MRSDGTNRHVLKHDWGKRGRLSGPLRFEIMARRKRGRAVNGWLILDKPSGMTSTHAVNAIKRMFDARKAGHAGTLDPLATGILPIAFGEATKTVNFAVESEKGYRFTIRWGEERTTDDSEGDVIETSAKRPTLADVEAALEDFIGEIEQVPPQFSAIKVNGQRAYDLARDGEDVALQARTVVVDDLRVIDVPDEDHMVLEADCGKGTYVRAIARDLGRKLGCFGHISALRRTRVGGFDTEQAIPFEELQAAVEDAPSPEEAATLLAEEFLQPVASALRALDEVPLAGNDVGRIKRGQPVILRGRDAPIRSGLAYATDKGELIALGQIEQGAFVPTRVFNL